MDDVNYRQSKKEKCRRYLPLATAWVLAQERFIMESGMRGAALCILLKEEWQPPL